MDNVTHGLFGLVLARAGLGRGQRWAAPLLVVAANAPDFESLIPARNTADYLLNHRGASHGIVGVCVEAVLITAATLLFLKVRKYDGPAHALHVLSVAFLGILSHIFLDWLNTYGIHPWYPFNDSVYYGDLTFIIDPWFWMLLWGGCFLSARDTRSSNYIYGGLGALMTAIIFYGQSYGLPGGAVVAWLLLLFVVVALRVWRGGAQFSVKVWSGAGKWALAGVSIYLGLLLGFSRTSVHLVRVERPNVPAENFSAHPTPGVPWRYTVLVDRGARVEQFQVSALRGSATLNATYETLRDDPVLNGVKDTQ
jgi:inner membrane protein